MLVNEIAILLASLVESPWFSTYGNLKNNDFKFINISLIVSLSEEKTAYNVNSIKRRIETSYQNN